MRFLRLNLILLLMVIVSSCDLQPNVIPSNGLPTSTPFQPQPENASNSPYAGAAPTPIFLPTLTPPAVAPTKAALLPADLPADMTVPDFTVVTSLKPLTGLPPSD